MNKEFIDFVKAHESEDTARLLLSGRRYPSFDMAAVVQQIEGRRTAREKWPSLLSCDGFLYPPRLNREQASSEVTAVHKAGLCLQRLDGQGGKGDGLSMPIRIADLTGGMGIDTFALAGWKAEAPLSGDAPLRAEAPIEAEVDYVEQSEELCRIARSNAEALGLRNVHVHCGDSMEWLRRQDGRYDLIFIDPARRDERGRKVAAFEECTPDILAHRELLMSKSEELLVKASPMIDITLGAAQMGGVSDIYVVAVQGECKEVLFRAGKGDGEPLIHCHHLHHGRTDEFVFTRKEEDEAEASYASEVKEYLYEPHAALMKAGPFKMLSQKEEVDKLARNTHLYTSDRFIADFPGRIFKVLTEIRPTRKEVLKWLPEGRAHVVTRNYPVAAAELQRQMGLREGGEHYVVATSVGRRRSVYLCHLA